MLDNSQREELCKIDEDAFPTPNPIFGLPCRDECYDGEEFSVDPLTGDWNCSKCPANMYSVGKGGIRIDGTMGAFEHHNDNGNAMPLRMESSCQVLGNETEFFYRNDDC